MYGAMIINENVNVGGLAGHFVLAGYNSILKDEGTTYQVVSIEGLNPPKAQLNFTKAATIDGAFFNSATLPTRNIVINLKINNDVERVRADINNICRIKDKVRFFYKTNAKEVMIDCYVESVEYNLFERSEVVQISLICPSPNFKSVTATTREETLTSSGSISNIVNESACDVGFKMTVTFNDPVSYLSLSLSNSYRIRFNNYSMQSGDILTVNAYDGYFNCTLKKASDSKTINFIPYLTDDSTIVKLAPGTNSLAVAYLADGSSASITIKLEYNTEYRGI